MTTPVTLLMNTASAADIQAHLLGCQADFVIALTQQTDLTLYAEKMAALATRFELWQASHMVGLLAVYSNQPPLAFITNVSVWPSLQGQGYAAQLMTACIAHVQTLNFQSQGFQSIGLKVANTNSKAIHFYQQFGFTALQADEAELSMRLSLNE
ncbi:MAG TPA: GNAT family N-acetyltransferase [Methylophilus sp.]